MRSKWFGLAFLFCLIWASVVPASAAQGGSYHAPAVTILVENAPDDLEITMNLHKSNDRVIPTKLEKKCVAWEQQFRLFREGVFSVTDWFGNSYDLKDAELVLTSGGKKTVVPLPREVTDRMTMNNVLTLDYRAGSVRFGAPMLRGPLMLALRLLVAVAVELLIFRLYDYRDRHTVLLVAGVTLVTFGIFNFYTYGWLNTDPRRIIVYIVFTVVLLFLQTMCLVLFVEENTRNRTTSATFWASLLASAVHYFMLLLLPV